MSELFGSLFSFIPKELDGNELSGTVFIDPSDEENIKNSTDIVVKKEDDITVSATNKEKAIYKCFDCNVSCISEEKLLSHIDRVHVKQFELGCNLCGYKASDINHVKEHQRNEHKNANCKVVKFNCLKCLEGKEHTCNKRIRRTNVGKYKCNKCEFRTPWSKSALNRHIEQVHLGVKQFKCNICDFESFHKIILQRHLEKHIKNGEKNCRILRIGCDKCDQNEAHNCFLPKKKKGKKKKKSIFARDLKCNVCDYKTQITLNLETHIKTKHEIPKLSKSSSNKITRKDFFCDNCTYKTIKGGNLKRHIAAIHSKNIFICEVCKDAFSLKQSLEHHVKSIHEGINRYSCNICNFKSYFASKVKKHINSWHRDIKTRIIKIGCKLCEENIPDHECDIPKFNCNHCDYYGLSKNHLKHHILSIHEKIVNHKCNVCGYKSYFKTGIRYHQIGCHPDLYCKIEKIECIPCKEGEIHEICERKRDSSIKKEFVCNSCGIAVKNEIDLSDHIQSVHEGVDKFACGDCDFKSFHYRVFKYHFRSVHRNEPKLIKRIGCKECEDNVDDHNCVKNGSIKCHLCNNKFYRQTDLQNHIQSYHEKKARFICNQCTYKSYWKRYVENHQERIHSSLECKVLELKCTPCDLGEIHDNCERKKETKYFSNKIQNINSHKKVKHHPKVLKADCEENIEHTLHTKKSTSTNISSVEDVIRFSCNNCDFKSYYSADVKNHMLSNHTEHLNTKIITIGCMECEKGKAKCMHGHRRGKKKIRSKNPYVKFACNICGYSSVVSRYVKDHQKNVHLADTGVKILKTDCRFCEKGVDHKRHMKKISLIRKNIQHKEGTYKCIFQGCLFSTDNTISIKIHKDIIHLNIKKAACNLCDFDSYFSRHVKTHQAIKHSDEFDKCKVKKIGCKECDENEHDHMFRRGNHKHSGKKQPKCQSCNKRFKNDNRLIDHYKNDHIGEFVYNCNKCSYGTNVDWRLKMHNNRLHEKRIWQCNDCSYYTTFKSNYLSHIRQLHSQIQLGTRKATNNLVQHNLCDTCGFSSISNVIFKHHSCSDNARQLTTQINGEKYNCIECQYQSDKPSDIKTHVMKVHNKQKIE